MKLSIRLVLQFVNKEFNFAPFFLSTALSFFAVATAMPVKLALYKEKNEAKYTTHYLQIAALVILFLFYNLLLWGNTSYAEDSLIKKESILDKTEWEKLSGATDYTENYKTREYDDREFRSSPKGSRRTFNGMGYIRIILIILIIGVLTVVLYFILMKFLNFFDGRVPQKELVNAVEDLDNNIHSADFETLLANALKQREYKLAVRILYIRTIKKLADKELIKLKKEKTNGQYVREIASPELGHVFSFLTLAYEKAWFSTHQVDELQYNKLSGYFNDFINKLE